MATTAPFVLSALLLLAPFSRCGQDSAPPAPSPSVCDHLRRKPVRLVKDGRYEIALVHNLSSAAEYEQGNMSVCLAMLSGLKAQWGWRNATLSCVPMDCD